MQRNFNGEIEIRLKDVPGHAQKIALEHSHLTMNWYHDRDLKLAVQWTRDGKPNNVSGRAVCTSG